MYYILSPAQIKEGHREEFIKATVDDARVTMSDQPGCIRFEVIQDGGDPNRIWFYEVWKDEAAFQVQLESAHLAEWREIVKDWRAEAPQGAGRGSHNIWPTDAEWK